MKEIYTFYDEECNFYYWNFLGIVPKEFPIEPGAYHQWEEGGNSGWFTLEELMNLEPKHFGLKAVLSNAGQKLRTLLH